MLTQNIREYNMKKKPSFKDRNKNPSKTRTKVSEEESSSREGCLRKQFLVPLPGHFPFQILFVGFLLPEPISCDDLPG